HRPPPGDTDALRVSHRRGDRPRGAQGQGRLGPRARAGDLRVSRGLALALTLLTLAGCSRPRAPISDCAAMGDAHPFCVFHDPEDFALLPAAHALVVSEMGAFDGSRGGTLSFFALESESRSPAYPLAGKTDEAPRSGWGDPACPGGPGEKLSPHGLD